MNEEIEQRQIPRRLDELSALVDRLTEAIEETEARLASVLSPETPADVGKPVADNSVPLANQLFALNTRLLASVKVIESINSRIEL